MAHYIFVKMRSTQQPNDMLERLRELCRDLTPKSIADVCENTAAEWPAERGTYYAIQNCRGLSGPESGMLTIGWTMGLEGETSGRDRGSHPDGSYAVIEANGGQIRFFSDQFGSRTLWFHMNSEMLLISTSQRAIVQLKGCFCPKPAAIAWFLSSGCQGPFISWDEQIQQVRPEFNYILECETWSMLRSSKTGMNLPASGSGDLRSYTLNFERHVSQAIGSIIRRHGVGEVLLPLSGGLDSRLLLALAHRDGSGDAVSLVNWGIVPEKMAFTDKAAAKRWQNFMANPYWISTFPYNRKTSMKCSTFL